MVWKSHLQNAGSVETFSCEFGAFGFTPEDITLSTPNQYDRPYASLLWTPKITEAMKVVGQLMASF